MTARSLQVSGLRAGYNQTVILEDLSFSVPAGRRLAVIGRNGMGKTTLLATLMGLTSQKGGTITLGDAEISSRSPTARARLGLGYVPQTRDIFRTLTVEENLISGLKGRPKSCLEEAYQLFPRLAERRGNMGWQLSGGEQQMLSTARTLLGNPSILLLDEPLEGLAPIICQELMQVFADLAASGRMTIILVEQHLRNALAFADEVLILERGRSVWTGRCTDLEQKPEIVEAHLGVSVIQSAPDAVGS